MGVMIGEITMNITDTYIERWKLSAFLRDNNFKDDGLESFSLEEVDAMLHYGTKPFELTQTDFCVSYRHPYHDTMIWHAQASSPSGLYAYVREPSEELARSSLREVVGRVLTLAERALEERHRYPLPERR